MILVPNLIVYWILNNFVVVVFFMIQFHIEHIEHEQIWYMACYERIKIELFISTRSYVFVNVTLGFNSSQMIQNIEKFVEKLVFSRI